VEVNGDFVEATGDPNEPFSRETIETTTLATTSACALDFNSDGDEFPDDCTDPCPYVHSGVICQCGDVNGNGKVNSGDAWLIMQSVVDQYVVLPVPENCDVNNSANNLCNASDARAIMTMLVGEGSIQQSCKNAEP
jgi:hypothetical protein